jgi:plastocyanin
MKKIFGMIVSVLALLALPVLAHAAAASVTVGDSTFSPASLSVVAGTTVTWTSSSTMAHTVTADNSSFDSGNLSASATYSHAFNTPGTYAYYCKYHGAAGGSGMSATITVTAAAADTSAATSTATSTSLTLPLSNATSTGASMGYTPGLEFQFTPELPSVVPNTTIDQNGLMAIVPYPDGPRLIKLDGDDTVYWVSPNNLKIPMHSRAVFLSYHNKDEDVQTVSQEEFDYYHDAKYIWLNGKGGIYKTEGTTKRLIISQAWAEAGLGADQVINVNKADISSYKTGAKVTTSDNVLN